MNILDNFHFFMVGLGASIIAPIMIFILTLLFNKKPIQAIKSGITVGVGIIGITILINLLFQTLSEVIEALVIRFDFKLTAVDIGYGLASAIAWGTEIVPLVFVSIVLTNILMIWAKWTNTLNIDIWNYWQILFVSSALYAVAGSLILAIIAAIINMALALKLADWTQKDVEETFGLQGISFPQIQTVAWSVITYPLNWLIDRIPVIRNINWSMEKFQNKLNFFGEVLVIGPVIGLGLGFLAGFNFKDTFQTTLIITALLIIMPKMVALLMEGLTIISESARVFIENRFPGRKLFIGLDSSLATGHPHVLTFGLLMVPIVFALAFLLPGNKTLPLGDLVLLPFYMAFAIIPSRGNLFRGLINGVIIAVGILYFSTYTAPIYTELASYMGVISKDSSVEFTSLAIGSQWFTWIIYWVFDLIS